MVAFTVNELAGVVGAVIGAIIIVIFVMWRDLLGIRERIARLEEIVKSLRERG